MVIFTYFVQYPQNIWFDMQWVTVIQLSLLIGYFTNIHRIWLSWTFYLINLVEFFVENALIFWQNVRKYQLSLTNSEVVFDQFRPLFSKLGECARKYPQIVRNPRYLPLLFYDL